MRLSCPHVPHRRIELQKSTAETLRELIAIRQQR